MQIVDFTAAHMEQAPQIARQNYETERGFTPALPPLNKLPDLTLFGENGLGVAAFDGDIMLGFLCSISPFPNVFRSTDAVGVFSPMGANGAISKNHEKIYAHLYQAAGAKWARAGASSHAICLYAHDTEARTQFFRYGFGMRCIDAIHGADEISTPFCTGFDFTELAPDEFLQVLPLDQKLDSHMAASPTFISRPSNTESSLMNNAVQNSHRYFVARTDSAVIAFLRADRMGETFVCENPEYMHITGAFCLPEYRGEGIQQNLLNHMIRTLKSEGYTRLGVDFESINPTAYGFWLKYFDAYTYGVVRRIDEYAILRTHP